jgi:hypothetical protein
MVQKDRTFLENLQYPEAAAQAGAAIMRAAKLNTMAAMSWIFMMIDSGVSVFF